MGSRTWIKIYCDKWLNGTIREETPELRGIWVDLLVIAGSGRYGDSGEIKITDRVGYLDQQLADLLQISMQKWATCKRKLVKTDRVEVSEKNIIRIKNWGKYQSEYERQKPYRQLEPMIGSGNDKCNQKLQQKVTDNLVTKSTTGDRDKRLEIIDKENRDKEVTPLNPPIVSSISNQIKKTIEDVLDAFRENILLDDVATISEDVENEIKIACGQYPPDWVIDAIKEAVARKHSDLPYIKGILWHRQQDTKKARRFSQHPAKYNQSQKRMNPEERKAYFNSPERQAENERSLRAFEDRKKAQR